MIRYLIDSDVFIQAKNMHYGFDFCPAFWEWLIQENRTGKVASIEKVADEIFKKDNELKAWAKARSEGFFLKSDETVATKFEAVRDWAENNKYRTKAVSDFLGGADG